MFLQQLANGLVLGSIYALCALGFTLIYGVARVINFAYGELFMLGALITLSLMTFLQINFFVALPISMVVIAALSVLIYVATVRPVMQGPHVQALLTTTGVLYVLREVGIFFWGTAPREIVMGFKGVAEIGDVIITYQRLIAVATMVVLVVVLYLILYRLRIGKALRAVAQNRAGAEAIGLNVDRTVVFAFVVSGAMACAAGALVGVLYAAEPSMGGVPLLKAFVVVIFGGLGSLPGAIVGGLVIGLIETFTGGYISYAFKDVFTFLIMIAVLLFRPSGLFGARATT